jgi:putative pyruvate formate lyase activating enzyme
MAFRAGYRELLIGGELERRAEAMATLARECRLCPRECLVARESDERGDCGAGSWASLVSAGPHHGEEPCLSGWRGAGTLFFGHCNLHCVFCQNHDISQDHDSARAMEADPPEVAAAMLRLQALGCHNINWVSPTHSLDAILAALVLAAQEGLRLPIVHNSNGYDAIEALRLLEGVVDIFMPDLKYADSAVAEELSLAPNYVESARAAIQEMHRQVGDLEIGDDGLARRGLLIRHLVLPQDLAGTEESLRWIALTLGPDTVVNLMAQYHPAHRAHEDRRLARRLTREEYRGAAEVARGVGLRRVMTQSLFI